MRLVLAHGILGFGTDRFDFGINYFNGVRAIFEKQGFEVFEPTVDPLGSLQVRSNQLAEKLAKRWNDGGDIYVVAHSMGGLDARRVIARFQIGTCIKNSSPLQPLTMAHRLPMLYWEKFHIIGLNSKTCARSARAIHWCIK